MENNPAKKERGILRKLTQVAALGATLVSGGLKAENAKDVSPDNKKPAAEEKGRKLADAETIKKIREKLGVKEVKVESNLKKGHKWSLADAKVFQGLKEEALLDGSMEKRIGAAVNEERRLKEAGIIEKDKSPDNPDEQMTSSSGWARNVVRHAEALQKSARDAEDAMNLIHKSYSAFVGRFQNPDSALGDSIDKNSEEKEKLTEWDRIGTKKDFRTISEEAAKLARIFKETAKKHGIKEINIQTETEMLGEISKKCAERIK